MKSVVIKVREADRDAMQSLLPTPLTSAVGFPAIFAAMRRAWENLTERQKVRCFEQAQEAEAENANLQSAA